MKPRTRYRPGAAAVVLLATFAAACAPDPPPQATAPSAAGAAAARPPATSPSPRSAEPDDRRYDPGPIETAAEYLAEPEFAGADLGNGQLLSLACAACHTFGAGEKTLIGPNLHGVFGRRAASVPGFDYSDALRATDIVWTPRTLEAWLADPNRFVQGTKMGFSGYHSPTDRRDLIAYLLHATQ